MVREALILFSCGSVGYAWLCAVTAPLLRAARSVAQRITREALAVFALALAALLLWSAIVAGALVLGLMLEPGAALALVHSNLVWPGVALGAAVWALQFGITRGVPRFGSDFESATALSIVAIANDTPSALARVQALYAAHAIKGRRTQTASCASGALFVS